MKNTKITFLNFRDLGGLACADSKEIVEGKLFRTAKLSPKNDADRVYIDGLNLDCIIDFRTPLEAEEKPDYVPRGVEYVLAPVFATEGSNSLAPTKAMLREMLRADKEHTEALREAMLNSYSQMPFAVAAYNEVFKRMDEGKTIAFHCTAGKDRTGICALLIELAFGRTMEQCREQYLLSNTFYTETIKELKTKLKLIHVKPYVYEFCIDATLVHEACFNIAFTEITQKYATAAEFLDDVYKITPTRLATWKEVYLK